MVNGSVVHVNYGIWKEWNKETCKQIDGTRIYHTEWSNPDLER